MKTIELSPYQGVFWIDWKNNPKSAKYHTPFIYHLTGNLNIETLKLALSDYVKNIFPTCSFFLKETKRHVELCIPEEVLVDQSSILYYVENENKDAFIDKICNTPFDLIKGPLFRFALLKNNTPIQQNSNSNSNSNNNNNNNYIFILNFHHIIMDTFTATSIEKIAEFYNNYNSYNNDNCYNSYNCNKSFIVNPSYSFQNYLEHLKQHYSLEKKEEDLKFWYQKLKNRNNTIEFNFKNNDYKIISNIAAARSEWFECDENTTEKLKKFARLQATTPFIILTAMYSALLYRYTLQEELTLSYARNLRSKEFSSTFGCIMNMIPLPIKMNKNMNFRQLISFIEQERKDTKNHQHCPFIDIISHLRKTGDPLQNEFNVSIAEAFLDSKVLNFTGIDSSVIPLQKKENFNDLSLSYHITEKVLFRLDYRLPIFSPAFIKRHVQHFELMLQHCLQNIDQKIIEVPLLLPIEKELMAKWNETEWDFIHSKKKTLSNVYNVSDISNIYDVSNISNISNIYDVSKIYNIFEENSIKFPDNIAVSFENQSITYQELNRKSNILANYLKSKCFQERVIALSMDRSIEMVVGILAILKAGFSYLPLNPYEPVFRLKAILEETEVKTILTLNKNLKNLQNLENLKNNMTNEDEENIRIYNFLCLDTDWEKISSSFLFPFPKGKENKKENENIAYIIYTSGSTGKPKGVMIKHESIINLILDVQKKLNFNSQDSVLSVTSYTFDMYGLELFLPLFSGGKHIICPESTIRDPQKFSNFLKKQKPTLIQATPAFFSIVLPFMPKKQNFDVPYKILCGGEPITKDLAQKLCACSEFVWNVYGPTEATILSTFYRINPQDIHIYIGRGFANTKLFVLDEYLNPVPIGVAGELYIAGLGLALGYWKNQDLTNEKFLNTKDDQNHNERIYKTGDMVRWSEEGYLEFIGRNDNQIKIRGHRVELSEIEEALNSHPSILGTVADIRWIGQKKHLVAYFVIKKQSFIKRCLMLNNEPNAKELQEYLKNRLPSYMLPKFYVKMNAIPLTSHGKIDRKQLPLPTLNQCAIEEQEFDQPLDIIELQLKKMWALLLDANENEFKSNENFFDIGGHSLLTVHLVSLIKEYFNVEMPVTWVYENNTILSQAAQLRKESALRYQYQPIITFNQYQNKDKQNIRKQTVRRPLFFVHPALSGAEVYYKFAANLSREIPFYAIDAYNLNSQNNRIDRIEELASLYLTYMKEIQKTGPYFIGGWSIGGEIAFEMAQQLRANDEEVATVFLLDTPLYQKEYLEQVTEELTDDMLIQELYGNQALYLNDLPEHYLDKVTQCLRKDTEMSLYYQQKPYEGEVILFKTTKSTRLNRVILDNQYNGWKSFCSNLKRIKIEADHFSLLEMPYIKEVAKIIENHMLQF